MTILNRRPMRFPINSNSPAVHIRVLTDPDTGQLYHRDDFDCWTRTGDEIVFLWPELNHTDTKNVLGGPRWSGIALIEVVEFTRDECLFEDVVVHMKAIDEDLKAMLDMEVGTAPLPVLAMMSSAQHEIRQCAKMMGIRLDG